MLQDKIKALNEFLFSIGIKETITQHEDISIELRAFNVLGESDDGDITVLGGQDLDGDYAHILTIENSRYAISVGQHQRLEYFKPGAPALEYEFGRHVNFNQPPEMIEDSHQMVSIAKQTEDVRTGVEEKKPSKRVAIIGFPGAIGGGTSIALMDILMASKGIDK